MVKAELNYNPYLLKTSVRFNGRLPRVNSLINPHLNDNLQTWIRQIPDIFANEMNGYDFDLEFTGTVQDFGELKRAFADHHVSEEQVHFFHKNELESRLTKLDKLDSLLKWLKNEPNHLLDYDDFVSAHKDLFLKDYPFVIITSRAYENIKFEQFTISVETVTKVADLDSYKLSDIPILFDLDSPQENDYRKGIITLMRRPDVKAEHQIFFLLSNPQKKHKIRRTIQDLGIADPKIVNAENAPAVIRYFELFLVTRYINESIQTFEKKVDELKTKLAGIRDARIVSNRELDSQISRLNDQIELIRAIERMYANKDNRELSSDFNKARNDFRHSVMKWQDKKIKTVTDSGALYWSRDLERQTEKAYEKFISDIDTAARNETKAIEKAEADTYLLAETDPSFRGIPDTKSFVEKEKFPEFATELMRISREEKVSQNAGLFDVLMRQMPQSTMPIEVLEKHYYFQDWRLHAIAKTEPVISVMLERCDEYLQHYSDCLTASYQEHLEELVSGKIEQREKLMTTLSEDERMYQADCEWLESLRGRITSIAED